MDLGYLLNHQSVFLTFEEQGVLVVKSIFQQLPDNNYFFTLLYQHQGVSTIARKAKSAGRSASQNKKGDPEALSKDPPSAKASPPRTGSDQVVQKSRNERRANRPSGRLVLSEFSSLSWEHMGSSEGSRATGPSRPGRSKPERESSVAVPKFGEWDTTPVSEGYSGIFNKVREEKQSSDAPARTSGAAYNRSDQGRKYKLGCSCFGWSRN